MDPLAALAPGPAEGGPAPADTDGPAEAARDLVDRAIFASTPSPVARGYRIVAASAGLTPDEQREIVQRAPSHGNLVDAQPEARGMAGFMLQSGRYGLLLSRHAGPEPSGRGGLCVWTDALLLAPEQFRRCGCDPLRLEEWARPLLELSVGKPAGTRLDPLSLRPDRDLSATEAPAVPGGNLPCLLRVIAVGLAAGPLIVTGVPNARQVMQWALAGIPAARRGQISFCYGLKFSSQRAFDLLFCGCLNGEMADFARDHDYAVADWQSAAGPPETLVGPWLEFVGQMLHAGRIRFLRALTDELTGDLAPSQLAGLGELATAAIHSAALETSVLEAALARVRNAAPGGPVQRRLIERLRRAVARRRADRCNGRGAAQSAGEALPP